MTRRKFQTSAELMLLSGLYLTRLPGPLSRPSNTGSTCTDAAKCQHCCGPPCCGQHEKLSAGVVQCSWQTLTCTE